jgi:hypothetical protein
LADLATPNPHFCDARSKVALDYASRADGAENELCGEQFGSVRGKAI